MMEYRKKISSTFDYGSKKSYSSNKFIDQKKKYFDDKDILLNKRERRNSFDDSIYNVSNIGKNLMISDFAQLNPI